MRKPTVLIAFILIAGCSSGKEPLETKSVAVQKVPGGEIVSTTSQGDDAGREDLLVRMDATVTALDLTRRTITLRGSMGQTMTFRVAPAAERLSEVKVGDNVRIAYERSIAYELRKPTKEEVRSPQRVLNTTQRASAAESPGMSGQREVRAVVQITGVNRELQLATIRAPDGSLITTWVQDRDLLKDLDVGDTAVIRYSESAVVSIDPAA